jgi:hypothetical protein
MIAPFATKSLPLISAILVIGPSKAYCQLEEQQKNGPISSTSVKIGVLELVDHDNQQVLNLPVQCEQNAANAVIALYDTFLIVAKK